ncbi:MAG: hypothetical protein IBX52_05755 [Bacterioplanes sp.]|nr:hypothetical protein [Bacterioplanes sp.]
MRLVRQLGTLLGLALLTLSAQALWWEHAPSRSHDLTYSEYLHSQGIPEAKRRSQCKDKACRYWIELGEAQFRVNKDARIVAQSRYHDRSYALYQQQNAYYLISSLGHRRPQPDDTLNRCASQIIIRHDGVPICVTRNDTLLIGTHIQILPIKPLTYQLATSHQGDWVLAMLDQQFNLHLIDASGHRQTHTQLHRHSDIFHTLSVFPQAPGNTWVALYEYHNKRNKRLSLYHAQQASVQRYTVTNSVGDDTGVRPSLYQTNKHELRLSTAMRSATKYYRIAPDSLSQQQPTPNPYTAHDMADVLLGVGLRNTHWAVRQTVESPPGHDGSTDTLASVTYRMNQSTLHEYRLSGQVAGKQIALTWLTSDAEQDMNRLERAATRKLYGSIGFDRWFVGPSLLRLEFASEQAGGIATYRDNQGNQHATAFENDYRRYALLVTGELGGFGGISYSRNNMPMAIGFFQSGLSDPDIYFDPDFELKKLLFVFGYDTAQYASRYLFNSRGFYLDGRIGLGFFDYRIGNDVLNDAKAKSGKKHNSSLGFAVDLFAEMGYFWQARSVRWGGIGTSLQLGLSADLEAYLNGVTQESKIDVNEIRSSFERIDLRWGPFARFNMMF